MRCSPHNYYFGTPAGALHRHLIPVHVILLRRLRDGVAPKLVRTSRPKMLACAVWRNGMQQQRYRALCERTMRDVRAYRLRMGPKPGASPRP
jgi:hypothetical protein